MFKFFIILFLLNQTDVKIIELIKNNKLKDAEKELKVLLKEGKTNEKIDYLLIYVYYYLNNPDSVIVYSNKFLNTYSESNYKVQVFYMLAKSYEKKNFLLRAFESYIEIVRGGESPYFRESEEKVLKLSESLSLREILKNINKLQNKRIYPDLLGIAFEKAKGEGDIKAQEEIFYILKEYYPEHERTKEIEKIFTRKKTDIPFIREKRGSIFLYLPISGPDSSLGKDFLKGFELSFKYRDYSIFDTRGDPFQTFKLLENHILYSSEFMVLVGPLLSKDLYAALPYFAKKKDKVFIVPALSYIKAFEFGENIVTLSNSIYQEIKAILERFITPNNFQRISIFIPRTEEGESILSFLYDFFKERKDIIYIIFSPDSPDFQKKIDLMVKFFKDTLGPDVIIFPAGTEESLLSLSSQIVFKGLKSKIISTGKFTTEDFALKSNRYVEDRVIFASSGIWDRSVSEKFISEFKTKYGFYPGETAYIGYDIGNILNYAFEKDIRGSYSFLNFLNNLIYFKGAYKFYLFGRSLDNIKFYKIKNKNFVPYEY